jgi:hypothetical protein
MPTNHHHPATGHETPAPSLARADQPVPEQTYIPATGADLIIGQLRREAQGGNAYARHLLADLRDTFRARAIQREQQEANGQKLPAGYVKALWDAVALADWERER